MAELLVRVVDKISADEVQNAVLSKRGHVIAVRPDGHEWTKWELTNPAWLVVREPKLSVEDAGKFLEPGPTAMFASKDAPQDRIKDAAIRQKRQFRLDIDALPEIKSIRAEVSAATLEL